MDNTENRKQLVVRLDAQLHDRIKAAAKASGFGTVSAWLISIVLDVLKRSEK
jgi:predicted HicB family RNase H-like nuclease